MFRHNCRAGVKQLLFGCCSPPISGFLNHVNNSCFVKEHFLITINSNKDFANPSSHEKQAGHSSCRATFILTVIGKDALPELLVLELLLFKMFSKKLSSLQVLQHQRLLVG